MDNFQPSEVGLTLEQLTETIVHFTADFFGFIAVAAVIAAFAFYFGRNRIVPLVASLYSATLLFLYMPYDLSPYGGDIVPIALFLVFVALGLIVFSGLADFLASNSVGILGLVILSAATAGLVIAVSIHILPFETFYTFSSATRALFDSAEALFFWLAAPLVAIFFFNRG